MLFAASKQGVYSVRRSSPPQSIGRWLLLALAGGHAIDRDHHAPAPLHLPLLDLHTNACETTKTTHELYRPLHGGVHWPEAVYAFALHQPPALSTVRTLIKRPGVRK